MKNYYSQHRHGSARWATRQEIMRAGLYSPAGVYIGQDECGNDMAIEGDSPICIIAGSGSGKGRDILMYSALADTSALYNDPRGELRAVMGNYLRAMGKQVYSINPAGMHTGAPWHVEQHGFNPFDILSADSPTLTEDVQALIAAIVIIDANTKDAYFDKKAREWCSAVLKFLVLKSRDPVTVTDLYKFLNMIVASEAAFMGFVEKEFLTCGHEDIAATGGEILSKHKQGEREFSSIVSSIRQHFAFMNSPNIQRCLGKPDFSMSVLSDEKAAVFLMVPMEYLGIWSSFNRLAITSAILHKQRKPKAGQVLFVIDEAAQLKRFEELQRLATYGRGAGCRLLSVWQDVGQMSLYGDTGAQTFLGSSQVRLFFGVRDLYTAQMISAMAGTQTIDVRNPRYESDQRAHIQRHISGMVFAGNDPFLSGMEIAHAARELRHRDKEPRALATPDEILNMPADRMIAFITGLNLPPIAGRKTPYYKRPELSRFYLPNPYHC